MKRWWAITPLVLFAVLVAVALQRLTSEHPAPSTFASPVRPSPAFDIEGLDGGRVTLADFKGRPVLLNLWATWCAPCRLEHPLLVKMAGEGVEIVGVLYKDPNGKEAAHRLLVRDGNPFAQIGLDPEGELGIEIGISGVPESFLIDANGMIVKTKRNYFTPEDAQDFVSAFRAEVAKSGAAPRPATAPAGG